MAPKTQTAVKDEKSEEVLSSQERPKPEPPPDPEPEEGWASPDDLGGDRDWQEVKLPMLGKKVRVRYLGQDDLLPITRLPDMTGLNELAGEEKDKETAKQEAFQNLHYTAAVVHLAVMAHGNRPSMKPKLCGDCGEKHPASLFTQRQAKRLHGLDAQAVARVAMPALGGVFLPFSEGPTHPDTPVSANTSE